MEEQKKSVSNKENGGGQEKVLKDEEGNVLPGFRFHPTDEELVGFYLRRKVEKSTLKIEFIKQIDIYKYDPWDLSKVSIAREKEWYFFCLRGRKYRNSIRPNRVTGSGFWKATGIDRPIYSASDSGDCIGLKKSLVYYRGSAGKGTKTDWMMHEFRLPSSEKNNEKTSPSMQEAEVWTLCRIFKRKLSYKKCTPEVLKGSSSKPIPADSSSKTNSFESDNGDEYKCYAASYIQQGDYMASNYLDEKNQLHPCQWNMVAQAPLQALYPNISNTKTANEFIKDENWDELGRIMEFMTEPSNVQDWGYYKELRVFPPY